jgi:Trypsin-like peptidase domain
MIQNIRDSVVVITNDSESPSIGTGFVIHRDERMTYILTCAHVVAEVGDFGKVKVTVDHHLAEEVANGDRFGCDLSVLAVKNGLTQLPVLKLGAVGEEGREFTISGYFNSAGTSRLEHVNGKLGAEGLINQKGDRTDTWNLEISGDSKHKLKKGYSGSPVVDKDSGYVLGVVSQKEGQREGVAISIEAVEKVWQEMPKNIICKRLVNQSPMSKIGLYSDKPEKWLQDNINRIHKDIDIEKDRDKYLTDQIAGINKELVILPIGNQKRAIERELEEVKADRDICRQNLETMTRQEEETYIEIERRKTNKF